MATRVSLTTQPDGSLTVTKTALSGDRGDRRAEAAWLQTAARHPTVAGGVVVVRSVDDQPFIRIVTDHVPGPTLRASHLAPAAIAALLARLATHLAALHELGLVHGKLSPDHVILGPAGPVLCSPSGTDSDPKVDSIAFGASLRSIVERWDDTGVPIERRNDWERLADRLGAADDPLPIRRAVRALERLAGTANTNHSATVAADARPADDEQVLPMTTPSPARWPRGVSLLVVAVAVALGGLVVERRQPTPSTVDGTEVVVDGRRARVGDAGDIAVVVDGSCDDQADVVLLDPDADLVWRFDLDVAAEGSDPANSTVDRDEFVARVVAEVPGVTDLVVEAADPCPMVWATGPAGRTLVSAGR